MRHRNPGKVTEGLWYLGRTEAGVYVLEDEDSAAIINGSLLLTIPDVLEQAARLGIAMGKIDKAVILHAHFDHVGIIPYLVRQNPRLRVFASARAQELLQTPRVLATINAFSHLAAEHFGKSPLLAQYDTDWRDDVCVEPLEDGAEIRIGKKKLLIMATPGHSSCAIAAYEPSLKALFPSDSGGIPFADTIVPAGNANFTQYQAGLTKLAALDVAYYCADHYGFLTGDEASTFGGATCAAAAQLRNEIASTLHRLGDPTATAQELAARFYSTYPDYFLDKDIMASTILQMVRHIAKEQA